MDRSPVARRLVSVGLALVTLIGAGASRAAAVDGAKPDAAKVEFFEARVRPVLAQHCQGCHNAEKQKGGVRLDTREAMIEPGDAGPVIEPGDPGASRLIAVVGHDSDIRMPPKGKLPERDIESLIEWVRMGAPWPESATPRPGPTATSAADPSSHWAFQPVRRPPVPKVRAADRVVTPVDAFILRRLEEKNIAPAELADRRTLIRRVAFDLTGLPPTPTEVDAFVADPRPDAYERLVDRLLASPHYGERWGRHWLDVARYGEDQAHTFEARLYPHGYRYRDWVVDALNADMPYDRFIETQIAGDLMEGDPSERQGRLAALGFFALGPVYYGKAIADELDDRIDTLCRGVLGLTVACARCHDHKFDPIPTADYYALSGIFASTRYKEYPAVPPEVVAAFDAAKSAIKAKTAEVEAFVALGSLHGLYALPPKTAERGLSAAARTRLASLRKELSRLEKSAPPPYPVLHSLTDAESPANARVHIRGNPENLGPEVSRHFLPVVAGPQPPAFTQGSGRLELARAITRSDNPLTARVIVNRVWEHHFGRGLVGTPSNFGTLGEPPTHPELLDWLAARFVDEGWSLKSLHKTILLSTTYRQSSRINPRNAEIDADNTLLWRMNRRRLEVEAWRDAMLAVSGELDPTLGGPSRNLAEPDHRRRTLYGSVSRHNLDNLLRLFDFPDPNLTCDRRVVTSVPLQQLFVLNSEFMTKRAKALARRVAAGGATTEAGRVAETYRLLYGRDPAPDELRLATEFLTQGDGPLGSEGDRAQETWRGAGSRGSGPSPVWVQLAQALLASNEFMFVD